MTASVHRLQLAEPVPPRYRGDCLPGGSNAARPCRWAGCRHNATGDCVLDVAESGGASNEEVARVLGVHRSRVSQIEVMALKKIVRNDWMAGYGDHEGTHGLSPLAAASQSAPRELEGAQARGPGESRYPGERVTTRLALTNHAAMRPEPKALAARAWQLYVEGAPCWADVACVLRAGHAGECELPEDIRRARAGEDRAKDRRVAE